MAKYTQNYTINLTGSGVGNWHYVDREKQEYVTEKVAQYFSQITIGVRRNPRTNKPWIKYTCSLIQLFTDVKLRSQFLEYSEGTTNEMEIALRRILSNPVAIEANICKIAGKIGDLCLKKNILTYRTEGYSYTKENYLKGGVNQIFSIDLNRGFGINKFNDGEFDLTEYYYRQKEIENEKKQMTKELKR